MILPNDLVNKITKEDQKTFVFMLANPEFSAALADTIRQAALLLPKVCKNDDPELLRKGMQMIDDLENIAQVFDSFKRLADSVSSEVMPK